MHFRMQIREQSNSNSLTLSLLRTLISRRTVWPNPWTVQQIDFSFDSRSSRSLIKIQKLFKADIFLPDTFRSEVGEHRKCLPT